MQNDYPASVHDGVRLVPWQASWAERFCEEKQCIINVLRTVGLFADVYGDSGLIEAFTVPFL